jgi:ATP-binding cassette, subfamily B (MDR/TAP), member 1
MLISCFIWFFRVHRFSTKFELTLNAIGLVGAAAAGAAQPLMSIIFGNLTNSFVEFGTAVATGTPDEIQSAASHFRHVASLDASYLVYIGLGMFLAVFIYMYAWIYTGEVTSKRIRENYLQAILRQDIAFFDNVGAGEIATRIQTDTRT